MAAETQVIKVHMRVLGIPDESGDEKNRTLLIGKTSEAPDRN